MRAAAGGVSNNNSNMQQTLTVEAAAVLKRAVAEAGRRGHAQATPLHVAAALLSDHSSALRRACLQAHPSQGAHLPQCRALELCFSIALDRLQAASQPASPPPSYSNALVAALKRAQAHQRRGGGGGGGASPDQPHHPQPPLLAVKVELDQLVISILDDPSVSRVMREAGFNSTDIKSHLEEESSAAAAAAAAHHGFDTSSISLNPVVAGVDYRGGVLSLPPPPPPPSSSVLGGFHTIGLHHHHHHHHHHPSGGQISAYSQKVPTATDFSGVDIRAAPAPPNTRLPLPVSTAARMGHAPLYSSSVQIKQAAAAAAAGEGQWRLMVEVLVRRKKKNPVMVMTGGGRICSSEAMGVMAQNLERAMAMEPQLRGAAIVSDISHIINSSLSSLSSSSQQQQQDDLRRKLAELSHSVHNLISMGGAAIINLGDLQWLLLLLQQQPRPHSSSSSSSAFCPVQYAIHEITSLLSVYQSTGRFWLVAISTEQTYFNIRCIHPNLECQWDLQSLPSSPPPSSPPPTYRVLPDISSVPESFHDSSSSSSLVLSLLPPPSAPLNSIAVSVPPADDDAPAPLPPKLSCCSECLRSYEKEALLVQEQDCCDGQPESPRSHPFCDKACSISDQTDGGLNGAQPASLPLWLRKALPNGHANGALPKEGKASVAQRLRELQNKWNQTCLTLHHHSERTSCINASSHLASLPIGQFSLGMSHCILPQVQPLNPRTSAEGATRLLSLYPGINGRHPLRVMNSNPPISILQDGGPCGDGHTQANGRSREESARCNSLMKAENLWQAVPAGPPSMPTTEDPGAPNGNHSDMGYQARVFPQIDQDALSRLCKGLAKRISWQAEVISTIANTVIQCRSGLGKRRRVSFKRDAWLLFLGSDRSGKRQMAEAMSELLFGEERKPICLSFGKQQSVASPMEWSLGGGGAQGRGKMPLDQLAEAVRHNPSAVVFLEDFEQADSMFRSSLLHAMERSRLVDSFGRDVNFNNVIVVMASSVGTRENSKGLSHSHSHSGLDDCCSQRQEGNGSPGKRKGGEDIDDDDDDQPVAATKTKKPNLALALDLDLNMSAEENDNNKKKIDSPCHSVTLVSSQKPCMLLDDGCTKREVNEEEILLAARQHLREFCDLVDAAVVFACSPL